MSQHFLIGNGARQGGILSPYLFTRHVRGLIQSISACRVGCSVAGLPLNIVAYADDMVLLTPSWHVMQELLYTLDSHCHDLDIACNTSKTVCMVLKPLHKNRVVANEFPCFTLGGVKLKFVEQFRHLGHILNNSLNDDDDIKREIQNLYIRTNMVISRFRRCSTRVERFYLRATACVFMT